MIYPIINKYIHHISHVLLLTFVQTEVKMFNITIFDIVSWVRSYGQYYCLFINVTACGPKLEEKKKGNLVHESSRIRRVRERVN